MVSADLHWEFDDRAWADSIEFSDINLMPSSDVPPAAGTPPTPTPAASSTSTPPNDAADAAKPRRARTSKPKVKTGCNNCKYVDQPRDKWRKGRKGTRC